MDLMKIDTFAMWKSVGVTFPFSTSGWRRVVTFSSELKVLSIHLRGYAMFCCCCCLMLDICQVEQKGTAATRWYKCDRFWQTSPVHTPENASISPPKHSLAPGVDDWNSVECRLQRLAGSSTEPRLSASAAPTKDSSRRFYR